MEKEKEERREKAARDKKSAKAGKRNPASKTRSSGVMTTSSSEGEGPAQETQAKTKGMKSTRKPTVKVPSKRESAKTPNGKLSLEEPAQAVIPAANSASATLVKRQARTSTSASNARIRASDSGSEPMSGTVPVQEVSSASETEAHHVKKEIKMSEVNHVATLECPKMPAVMNVQMIQRIRTYYARILERTELPLPIIWHRSSGLKGDRQGPTRTLAE